MRTVLDQEGTLRLVQINGVPHVIAAHTVLRSDRSGPAGGTLVFARRIAAPEIASIGADTQLNVQFAMLDDRAVAAEKPELLVAPDGRRILRRSDNVIEGQLRLDTIDNHPLAVLYTTLPRTVMQSGQQGVRYLVGWVALLISIVVAAWHAYSGRLRRTSAAAATSETRYRAIFDRAASGIVLFDPTSRRVLDANPQAQRLIGASLDELRRRDVATIFDTPVSLVGRQSRTSPPRTVRRSSSAATTNAATWNSRSWIWMPAPAASTPCCCRTSRIGAKPSAARRNTSCRCSTWRRTTRSPAFRTAPSSTKNCRGSSKKPRVAAIRCRSFTSTATTSRTSTIRAATRSATTIFVRSRDDCATRSRAPTSWCAWAATNSSWSRATTASNPTARRLPSASPRR